MLEKLEIYLNQVRVYKRWIPDGEIDAHLTDAGVQWKYHQCYLTVHYNRDENDNGSQLRDDSILNIPAHIYGGPKFVEVSGLHLE